MLCAEFFIVDYEGVEVPEAGYFTCYSKARKACIEYSRTHNGLYTVSVCVPGSYYASGKIVEDK